MFHQGVALSVISLFALAASAGCQARATSPLSPSLVTGSGGGLPQSASPRELVTLDTFSNLVTSSVQVPFAYRVFFDATAEWVDLSGKLHIVTRTRFLPGCLVPNTCLSVDIHANVSGIHGLGEVSGIGYAAQGVSVIKNQLAQVDLQIKTSLLQIELKRQEESQVKEAEEERQDREQVYLFQLAATIDALGNVRDAVLCLTSECNLG